MNQQGFSFKQTSNGLEHNNYSGGATKCLHCVFRFLVDRFPGIITLLLQLDGFDHPCQADFQDSFASVGIHHLNRSVAEIMTDLDAQFRDLSS